MPERVEATVKTVEEVLAELVKVDIAVVEVVKKVVTEKLEVAVEVVEEMVPEEVEAAVVEVVKEEVKANRSPRTLFPRLLLRCPRRLKLSSSMWSRTLSLRLMWPRQSTTTFSALELSRRRARRGRRATGGSGLRQESGRVW